MFLTDKPISSKVEDQMQRSGFAENLAKTLLHSTSTDTLVVGLQGSWGTGKTSLLYMMKEVMAVETQRSSEVPILFDLNPWNYAGQQQLISMFFEELSLLLKRTNKLEKVAEISGKLQAYS